jgi:hypothetical protein
MVLGVLVSQGAISACDQPKVVNTIPDIRARIEWRPVAGATGYRVQLLSRVPNGRVIASYDTVVGEPAFVSPQPLAEQRAKVTVRVRAICGKETSAESVASFVVDTSALCRLEELGVKRAGGRAEIQWKAVPGAGRYEVMAHDLVEGKLVASRETRATGAQLELGREAAVVSVRPACASGLGEAVYRVVAAD